MSSSGTARRKASRFAIERELAPHVDEKWAESFLVELRILNATGVSVGAALSEVESHCAESSASAQDAFGDPVTYARALNLPVQGEDSGLARLLPVAPTLVQVGGMLILLWSFTARRQGESFDVKGGQLIALFGTLLIMVAVARWPDHILRMVIHRPILTWTAFMATTAAFTVPLLLVTGILVRLPTAPAMGLGTTMILGALAWDWLRHSPADPITSPLGSPESSATVDNSSTATPLRAFALLVLVRGSIPISTLIMLGVAAWLTR
jgi:hypothetical protein